MLLPMDLALKAVADPTRRAILRLVAAQEMTAGHIAARFTCTRPAISQHLQVLHQAELVTIRAEGRRRWYRAQPASLAEARAFLDEMWCVHLAELEQAADEAKGTARSRRSTTKAAR